MVAELLSALALLAPGERAVTCAEVIGQTRFPYVGNRDARYRYRTVLDAVSAPGVLLHAYRSGPPSWPYFGKTGMIVRGGPGAPATVSVPPAWRHRVAISWGNAGHGVFHTVRFPRCATDSNVGHAWAGGFFLKRAPACVPLRFGSERRSATLWFGIARRCARAG